MPVNKKKDTVIALCIQEPFEEGSSMDFGIIKGDDLRFLHQAFITDTIINSLEVESADIRLYYIGSAERKRLVKIITDYITGKLKGKKLKNFEERFIPKEMGQERWGERAQQAFEDCSNDGYKNVLLIGSRTPTITAKMMKTTIKMLKQSDAVFGPTPDGRYYIIGMAGSPGVKLSEFDWKSPSIYSEIASALTDKGLSWSELEIWYCVETTEDLEMMARDINQYRFEGDMQTARETELVMERILAKLES